MDQKSVRDNGFLPVFTGFYLVFTGFYLVFTGFYLVFTGFYLVFTGFYLVFTGFYLVCFMVCQEILKGVFERQNPKRNFQKPIFWGGFC